MGQKLTNRTLFAGTLTDDDLIHLVDVTDTTDDPAGSSFKLKLLQLKSYINAGISYPTTFLQLTDTPNSYTGKGLYLVQVNAFETGLQFTPYPTLPTVSGTLNYLAKFTPDGSSLGNSQIFDNNINVGVGTNTPSAKLHILGTTNDSSAYALKASSLSGNPLLWARNDGYVTVNTSTVVESLTVGGNIVAYNPSGVVRNYASGQVAITYAEGTSVAYLRAYHTTGGDDIKLLAVAGYSYLSYNAGNGTDAFYFTDGGSGSNASGGWQSSTGNWIFGEKGSVYPFNDSTHKVTIKVNSLKSALYITDTLSNPLFEVKGDASIWTGGTQALATGTFLDQTGKTVTIKNGLVISIV